VNDWIGRQLSQYQIIEELGRGGMAVVYKAWQPALERYVAIKVLPSHFVSDQRFLARFRHEALAAAQLNHPNIVTVHDVGQEESVHFIVMEYLEGLPLNNLLHNQGPLPLGRVTPIVEQLSAALDYAHRRGLVHRDIKPANIIIGRGDHATLTDFGIAKALSGTSLTQTGTMVGTPQYMAPEQVLGATVDHHADIYALGIVCYEMLAGDPPFTGDTAAVLYAHAHRPPPSLRQRLPRLPAYVEDVLGRALEKDPGARFASAGEMSAALQTPSEASAPVAPITPPYQSTPPPAVVPPSAASMPQLGAEPPATGRTARDGSTGPQVWLLVGGAAAAALVFIAAILFILLGGGGSEAVTPITESASPRATTAIAIVTSPSTDTPRPTLPSLTPSEPPPGQTVTPSATQTPPANPTPTPTPTPTTPPPPPPAALRLVFVLGSPGDADIYLTDADGTNQRQLAGGSNDQAEPSWSPDEQRVAYQSDQAGNYDVWVISADGRNQRRLTTDSVDEREPAWSPNGQQIVYRRGGAPNGDGELWVMAADGGSQRRLGDLAILGRAPDWSPDGQQVVFMSERGGTWNIYLFDLSSGDVRRVTDCSAHCRFPGWSPDGQYIVYHSTSSASSFNPDRIWRQRADGSGTVDPLIAGNNPGRATWSQVGLIAFNTNDGIEITNSNGSNRRVLRNGDDGWAPDWSR
jgi:serine/threonine-protein kinase